MRQNIVTVVLLFITVLTARAQRAEIFSTKGKALGGYDVVAFFSEMKPVKGSDTLTYFYKDAAWHFSSQANLQAFKAKPEQYIPQYGGYCAYGAAEGHKAPTEADTWTIVEGKLYFNYNQKVKGLWVKDQPGFIRKADMQWPLIKDKE